MTKLVSYVISFALIAALFILFASQNDKLTLDIDPDELLPPSSRDLAATEDQTIQSFSSDGIRVSDEVGGHADQAQTSQTKRQTVLATLSTNEGPIVIELFVEDAPKTVENFITLAKNGFYDGTKFHRVIKEFMIQGGDPQSRDDSWADDGTGGPGYQFEDEINQHKLVRGIVAMANSGPDTNGSQFFVVTAEGVPWLDGKHTAFGKVVEGMETVNAIEGVSTNENDHPLRDMTIRKIEISEINPVR